VIAARRIGAASLNAGRRVRLRDDGGGVSLVASLRALLRRT